MKTLNELIEEQVEEFFKLFCHSAHCESMQEENFGCVCGIEKKEIFIRTSLKTIAQATADALRVEKFEIVESVLIDPELEEFMKEATGHNSAVDEVEKKAKDFFTEPCVECGHPDGHSNTCVLVE